MKGNIMHERELTLIELSQTTFWTEHLYVHNTNKSHQCVCSILKGTNNGETDRLTSKVSLS